MTQPTKEQIEEYIRNNKLDIDESYPRSDWWKFKQRRDELIKDIAKLRERNAALERKAQAFDEVKNNIKEELDSYSVLYKETQDPRYSLLSGVYENIFNYIEELEREE
ncbi:hypothetical protein CF5_0028 [Staphylococcus phage CF5]|uniref:Uncharacterized protein n=1 Tax=Staphylococcus phage CF5 TaxID=3113739 RepID=A0AAX4J7Q8_9CAUD|nr:hypothetical protein CF5_0028 [Staphylococcus phage CF5]